MEHEDYLRLAKEADQEAARASDPNIKDNWERIAKNYRDLADAFYRLTRP